MSVADKLTTVAENVPKVFEAGKQAEYDRFWDILQNKGEPANYYYKFSYSSATYGWTDDNYNPKYPIVCGKGTTAGMALFYSNKAITDTKVPIIAQGSTIQSAFANADNLTTIRSLSVHEGVLFSTSFVNCSGLKHIIFEGVIGSSIDFSYSPSLTVESMKSVILHLKDYSGTSNEFSHSIKFTENRWNALEADSTSPNGSTWKDYVDSLGWNY